MLKLILQETHHQGNRHRHLLDIHRYQGERHRHLLGQEQGILLKVRKYNHPQKSHG